MIDAVLDWVRENPDWVRWAVGASALVFVASVLLLPWLVSRIPTDYFAAPKPPSPRLRLAHPLLRLLLLALKNTLGALFLVAGIVMLLTPGQGVLSILIGLSLLSFPGKRRLELAIVRQPKVLAALNWIRAKWGRPALRVMAKDQSPPDAASA